MSLNKQPKSMFFYHGMILLSPFLKKNGLVIKLMKTYYQLMKYPTIIWKKLCKTSKIKIGSLAWKNQEQVQIINKE